MAGITHSYLHYSVGLALYGGLELNTFDIDGSGNDATAGQFGVDAGSVADEDIHVAISAVLPTVGLPIFYMTGSQVWNRSIRAGYTARTLNNTGSTRLCYNQNIGGTWQLTEVTNNRFVLCHIFATTDINYPMIAIMGQEDYATKTTARTGADSEIFDLVTDQILFPESKPIGTIIMQTSDSYGNAIQGRTISTDAGEEWVSWRNIKTPR